MGLNRHRFLQLSFVVVDTGVSSDVLLRNLLNGLCRDLLSFLQRLLLILQVLLVHILSRFIYTHHLLGVLKVSDVLVGEVTAQHIVVLQLLLILKVDGSCHLELFVSIFLKLCRLGLVRLLSDLRVGLLVELLR